MFCNYSQYHWGFPRHNRVFWFQTMETLLSKIGFEKSLTRLNDDPKLLLSNTRKNNIAEGIVQRKRYLMIKISKNASAPYFETENEEPGNIYIKCRSILIQSKEMIFQKITRKKFLLNVLSVTWSRDTVATNTSSPGKIIDKKFDRRGNFNP